MSISYLYQVSHLIAVSDQQPVQIPADGRPEEHAVWFRWTGTRQRLHVRATEENVLYVWWEIDVIECVYMHLYEIFDSIAINL